MTPRVRLDRGYVPRIEDLMLPVDIADDFTLGDLCHILGDLDAETLRLFSDLIRCHLQPFIDECAGGRTEIRPGPGLHHLRVSWICEYTAPGVQDDEGLTTLWLEVDGIGETWPEHLPGGRAYDLQRDASGSNRYALDLVPLHRLRELPIRLGPTMRIHPGPWDDEASLPTLEVAAPDVTLLQLVHALFWEFSFWGGTPEERDAASADLRRSAEERETPRRGLMPAEDVDPEP